MEMVIVIVVVGVIFAIGALVLGRAFESYVLAQQTTDVDWQGRVALERMVRELREIRSATAADLALAANEIRFNDLSGAPVCFRLSGGTLQRSADGPAGACGTTSPQPLADNVAALNFDYYQHDGNVAVLPTQVFYITVRAQVTDGSISESYRVSLQPRRF